MNSNQNPHQNENKGREREGGCGWSVRTSETGRASEENGGSPTEHRTVD